MDLAHCLLSLGIETGVELEITSITTDSRRVSPGALFIALTGAKTDGHRYLSQAIDRGAVAVIVEDRAGLEGLRDIPGFFCPEIKERLWELASSFYQAPSRDLLVIGVTGTNGKTSTTYFIKEILDQAGLPCGLIGTIQNIIGDEVEEAINTTPDALELQRLLARMRDQGLKAVVMEVSSHALSLGRVNGVEFDHAVFTNLTEDHLDFHGEMESYLEAKLGFLELLKASSKPRPMLTCNASIEYGDLIRKRIKESGLPVGFYGLESELEPGLPMPEYLVFAEVASLEETRFNLKTPLGQVEVSLSARGYFTIYNSLAAAATAFDLGIPAEKVVAGMSEVQIPGRFQLVENRRGFLVVIDYAHTDAALSSLLRSARRLHPERVITVFGCGGDRDRQKRPLMGRAASSLSDLVVVTSDNPRGEEPLAIIEDIRPGLVDPERAIIEPDRKTAIQRAIKLARAGDMVVIAGKGHETYQIFKDKTIHFDDSEIAREALES